MTILRRGVERPRTAEQNGSQSPQMIYILTSTAQGIGATHQGLHATLARGLAWWLSAHWFAAQYPAPLPTEDLRLKLTETDRNPI